MPALRLAALQIVAQRAPERAHARSSSVSSTSGSEAEQQAAFQAMGADCRRPQAPALLVSALDQLAAGKVQPGAQVELLEAVEKSTAPTVKARWEKQQAAWAASSDPLAAYRFCARGRRSAPRRTSSSPSNASPALRTLPQGRR